MKRQFVSAWNDVETGECSWEVSKGPSSNPATDPICQHKYFPSFTKIGIITGFNVNPSRW
jgi:hypothetical protein